MKLDWQIGKVVKIEDETPNTRRLFIQATSSPTFSFLPGQFVTLNLPIHEKKNRRLRSYSIASAPNDSNIFELIIVLVEDGLGSSFIFNNLKVGDEITFRGPVGVFVLPETIDRDIFMICTGTGIAPFRSMIFHLYKQQIPTKKIHLIFGTRTRKDLLYHKEFLDLQEKFPRFTYTPVLSRESWEGKSGYVHPIYLECCANNPEAQFMICGWKKMVDEASENLRRMGFDKKQIQFELYG